MQLPREVIQQLRDVVFGFDTFYVTSVENYQANGVLFKGNLRGRNPAESYTRTAARLKVFFSMWWLQCLAAPIPLSRSVAESMCCSSASATASYKAPCEFSWFAMSVPYSGWLSSYICSMFVSITA